MRKTWYIIVVAALIFPASGCERCQGPSSRLLTDAAAPPDFAADSPAKAPDAALSSPVLWKRASKTHDAIDLASLADVVGAAGLLDNLERGGDIGRTALLALPYARHGTLAYRRLAEIALQTTGDTQLQVLSTIQHIALRHRLTQEPLDREGTEFCARALREIGEKTSVPKRNRNMALSTERLVPFVAILNPRTQPRASGSAAPSGSR